MLEVSDNKIESSLKDNLYENTEDDKNKNNLNENLSDNINKDQTLEKIIKKKPKEKGENEIYYRIKPIFDEKTALLNEKEGLKLILEVIQKDLDLDEETLEEVYEPYLNNEDMTKREIKQNISRLTLDFMFYVISPLFGVINLVAIFESLLMMKILWQILQNALIAYYDSWAEEGENIPKLSVKEFCTKYNYYYLFFEDATKDSFDFNLMLFTAFLGDILLKSRGFRISTSVFALVNSGAIFLILSFSFLDYNQHNNTYSVFKFFYLLLSYILLLVGVGASALLSQQIIVDSNYKYNDRIEELNKKRNEERREERERRNAKKEEIKNMRLLTLDEMIRSDVEEKKDILIKNDEENKEEETKKEKEKEKDSHTNFKKSETEIFKDRLKIETIDEKIEINESDERNKEENEELKKSLKKIKNNIQQIDKRKVALSRSKTTLVTVRDEIRDRMSKKIKEKELRKKQKEKAKANKKKRSRFESFFTICIMTIIGYFLKYWINLIIFQKNDLKIDKYITLTNCGNDTDCFQSLIRDENLSITNKGLFDSLTNNIYKDGQNSFYIIIIIYGACIAASILLYSFFVCIFDKRKKKQDEGLQKNNYRICEICGYIIYSQNITLNLHPPFCECFKLLGETFQNCLSMVAISIGECRCCRICNDCNGEDEKEENNDNPKENNIDNNSENKNDSKNNHDDKIDINNENSNDNDKNKEKKKKKKDYEQCCNCCCQYKENDFRKNKQFFCYCYQAQRKYYWFNQFLTNDIQKKLVPFLVEYFILQIIISAFEKKYFLQFEDNYETISNNTNTSNARIIYFNNFLNNTSNYRDSNDSNDLIMNEDYSFLTFIVSFFLFFYFTLSFARIVKFFKEENKDEEKLEDIKTLSLDILDGTHGILIFDGLFALIFSSLYLSYDNNNNPLFENNNFLLVPILMNKYYYFTLVFHCISYSEEKRKFELISSSTLISIYISIMNFIISLIRNNISLKALYIIQLVFACGVICLFLLVFILIFIIPFCNCETPCRQRISMLFCVSSYICCFGGFWMTQDFYQSLRESCSEENFDFSADCCNDYCNCFIDCLCCNSCTCCCRSICPEVLCSCCKCCICYDCFECCDCFYCCQDECACQLC